MSEPVVDRGATIFFAFAALLHLAGVVSRFDRIYAELPEVVHAGLLASQLPLLLVEGYVLDRALGSGKDSFPVWMRLPRGPVRWALALATTYIGLFALANLQIEIGVFDPTPPEAWPEGQRLAWFLGFAVVASFPAYLLATSSVLPALRVLVWPLRRVTPILAILLAIAGGAGLALALLALAPNAGDAPFRELTALAAAVREHPLTAIVTTLAGPAASGAVGLARERFAGRKAPKEAPLVAPSDDDDDDDDDDA
ncbi:MAG: hypothetical protein H6711_17375 [Myxococcales bacterium]|nr:hypothetical protein [Myxococcales bacterium]